MKLHGAAWSCMQLHVHAVAGNRPCSPLVFLSNIFGACLTPFLSILNFKTPGTPKGKSCPACSSEKKKYMTVQKLVHFNSKKSFVAMT